MGKCNFNRRFLVIFLVGDEYHADESPDVWSRKVVTAVSTASISSTFFSSESVLEIAKYVIVSRKNIRTIEWVE